MSDMITNVAVAACIIGLAIASYLIGNANGYKAARSIYLPSLVEEHRAHAELIDRIYKSYGSECRVLEEEREWEDKLRALGLEVPDRHDD